MNLRRLYAFAKPMRPARLVTGDVVLTTSTVMEVLSDARPGPVTAACPDGSVEVLVRYTETGEMVEMRWRPGLELPRCVSETEWAAYEKWLAS